MDWQCERADELSVDSGTEYRPCALDSSWEVLPVERLVIVASPKPQTCFPLTLPSKFGFGAYWSWEPLVSSAWW